MNCSPLGEVNSAHGVSQQLLYTARTRFHLESLVASHCPVTVNIMKRIPFAQRDLKKLPDLAKQLLAGLDLLPEGNRNKASQLMALICLYDSFMDLKYQVDKTPFPQPGSIQRSDIALLLAIGLRQLTHLPFLEAFKRARRAKLDLLTIYRSTKEYEEYLAKIEYSKKGVIWDEYGSYIPGPPMPREQSMLLHRAGVPDFDLVVRRDGKAFQRHEFIELFNAVLQAPEYAAQVEPELVAKASDAESLEAFTKEVLVPNSWVDLEELVKAGLEVPYHEVIWLFDRDGKYIARAFRHTTHGGILGHLMATDEQVLQGKIKLLQGRSLLRQSPMGEAPLSGGGTERIYTLRHMAACPRTVTDPMDAPVVPIDDLVEVPGIMGGYFMVYIGQRRRDDWSITGRLVSPEPGSRDYPFAYLETVSWLWEPDLPNIYAHYDGPQTREWDIFSDQNVFLPSGAIEYQDRAMKLLQRTMRQAADALSTPTAASMLLEQLGQVSSITELEAYALVQYENEFASYDDDQVAADARARIHPETVAAVEALLQRRPVLSIFGLHSLWFALVGHHSTIDEITVEEETLEGLLTQLVVLAAGAAQGLPEIDYFQAELAAVAVAQWMAGKIGLDDVIPVASGLYEDASKLYRQRERIERLTWSVNGEIDRRAHARELGYLYVGGPAQ